MNQMPVSGNISLMLVWIISISPLRKSTAWKNMHAKQQPKEHELSQKMSTPTI